MATEATQTSRTLCRVSWVGWPVWMARLAAATKVEAKQAQRQPPLMAKARTAPAVQMVGRVLPPAAIRAWVSATGVSTMPTIATVRSATRKPLVQLAAFATLREVARVQTARKAR